MCTTSSIWKPGACPACSSRPREFVAGGRGAVDLARLPDRRPGLHPAPDPGPHRRRDARLRRQGARRDHRRDHRRADVARDPRQRASVGQVGSTCTSAQVTRPVALTRSSEQPVASGRLGVALHRVATAGRRATGPATAAPASGGRGPDGRCRRSDACRALTPADPIAGSSPTPRHAHTCSTAGTRATRVRRPAQHGAEVHQALVPRPRLAARQRGVGAPPAPPRRQPAAGDPGVARGRCSCRRRRRRPRTRTPARARAVYGPTPGSAAARRACRGTRRSSVDARRGGVQVARSSRVAEALPQPQHVAERRRGARRRRRERVEERDPLRDHPRTCVCCSITSLTRIAHGSRVAATAGRAAAASPTRDTAASSCRQLPGARRPSYGRRAAGRASRFHTITRRRK